MPKHPLSRFTRFRPTVSAMVRTAVWAAGVIFRSQPPTPTDADRCKPLMADANQMIAESCGNLMGPSWPKRYAGGDSAVLRHRLARKQGLQGLRFAPGSVGNRAESPVSAGLCAKAGEWGRCEPGCVPGSQVCTPAKRKTARIENSMLARVCRRFAGWVAEIGPRAFAHRLTHRTQVVVTFREARTRARV